MLDTPRNVINGMRFITSLRAQLIRAVFPPKDKLVKCIDGCTTCGDNLIPVYTHRNHEKRRARQSSTQAAANLGPSDFLFQSDARPHVSSPPSPSSTPINMLYLDTQLRVEALERQGTDVIHQAKLDLRDLDDGYPAAEEDSLGSEDDGNSESDVEMEDQTGDKEPVAVAAVEDEESTESDHQGPSVSDPFHMLPLAFERTVCVTGCR
jgi:hypothetical protein